MLFLSQDRATTAVKGVLESHPDRKPDELAKMCVEVILAMPPSIPEKVVDLALEVYDPGAITQVRRNRMRVALETAFNAS